MSVIALNAKALERDMQNAARLLSHAPQNVSKAAALALNRTIPATRAEAVRAVRGQYQIKAKDVRESLRIQKANPRYLQASLHAKGAPLPLYSFKVSPKTPNPGRRSALRVGVMRGQGGKLNSAFIARMQSGKVGVFERTGEFTTATRGRYAGLRREKIEEKHGPSAPQMLEHTTPHLERYTANEFTKKLNHEVARMLKGGKA